MSASPGVDIPYEWFNQRPEVKSNAGYRLAEGDASGKLTVGDEDAGRVDLHARGEFAQARLVADRERYKPVALVVLEPIVLPEQDAANLEKGS